MGKDADLLEAARSGNFQVVEKILSSKAKRSGPLASLRRGPGANVQDTTGYTALHHAALNGHKDVVSLLLAHEASCNVQDGKGSTPLHLAAWAGHTEVVKALLHQGPSLANVNHQNKGGETALHCAAQYGHTEAAQMLLAQGGDPTVPNLQAETALDLAAQYGRLHTVEVLVRAQPDLLRPYTVAAATAAVFPHTPLHRASRNGHREVVKLLLTHGHHVNVRTGQGAPLHEAALCGKVEVVRVLLEAGADPEVRDDCGHTVLDTIALINTPITQEITTLIKCHNQLISLDEDDEGAGEPPSWPPPIWPPPSLPPIPTPSELGSPYENVLIPTILHPEQHTDGESLSRLSENRASSRASDRESRASDRESRASDRESRTSDRESRASDRESRISDRDGRTSVASRVSEATSDWSIYDVPPPPKTVGGSDRGSLSYRSQTSECGDDDGVYEVPPPPRSCRSSTASLRASRDSRHLRPSSDELQPQQSSAPAATSPGSTSSSSVAVTRRGGGAPAGSDSSGSKVVEPLPPPKPPRRSMYPPSPTPDADQDAATYETIYFKGQDQSDYENVDVQQQQHRSRPTSSSFSQPATHDSSDSDYETPRPLHTAHAHAHSNRMYSTISFKPVKSRRTSKLKDPHVYENTIHRYENMKERYQTLRDRNHRDKKDYHHHNENILQHQQQRQDNTREQRNENLRDRNENVRDRNLQTLPRRPRASSAYAKIGSRLDSSDDSDGDHRPRTLEFRESKPKMKPQPMSPTHYQQPPTPDHPPPSARQAQISIHAKIQSVSVPPQEKRPSRDIETETEPEEVLAVEAGGSSCSLSSVSASLSDKSVSTDNIEEIKSDVPFAGLFRGSITPMEGSGEVTALERPRSLVTSSALRSSVDRGCRNSMGSLTARDTSVSGGISGGSSMGLLSPLEEAEEWARINDIMASFGGGLARESVFMAELEHEFQTRLGLSLSPSQQGLGLLSSSGSSEGVGGVEVGVVEAGDKTVGGWLRALGLPQYEDVFAAHGYDDTDFMNGGILELGDLRELGITQKAHLHTLQEAVSRLPTPLHALRSSYTLPDTVEAWLDSIRLPQYAQNFHKNGFGDMERVKKVWEIELTTVLEITRPGHRKRILASLGERPLEPELPPALNPHDLSLELTKLNSDISQLKEQLFNDLPSSTCRERRPPETATNTIRRSGTKKRSAPQPPKTPRAQPSLDLQGSTDQLGHLSIRDPSQLVVGVPNTVLTTWRHHPNALVSASVQYVAQYLGSTHVKELKGTESTMKSIQKLKKSTSEGSKIPKIVLSVSYRGVKFIDALTQALVCEHEIRNIHCACQDADDLSHFAYITKDLETKGHYCHVFRVQSRDCIHGTLSQLAFYLNMLSLQQKLSSH
ncbi:ankyrin repeat and sterile alpha motif domain-containing protein 1B-like isoform X2 [Homarus americanus]|uniref:ankyrin repeat and sterile alpha motif domain-containing protein 1B-like isoform X2 n=1 Tax=Homarus americanus TaxID=6706 RepID=UPI001C472FC7|nr:ankyrin repeat and sterile alpha motif domain-containing protein 1B-like isoform X2 [Homarus americanus]